MFTALEGHMMPDHVHMLVAIPTKSAVSIKDNPFKAGLCPGL
ncbi:transposase [Paenibacillus sp. FSL R5-0623]